MSAQKTMLRVCDLMVEKVHTAQPQDDLGVVRDRMVEYQVRHVPVVDEDGDLVGLVSHRDLLRRSLVEQADVPAFLEETLLARTLVRDVMVRDVETVTPDADLGEAARLMLENKYGCLPVVEGQRLVGILTEADFVRRLAEEGR